MRAAAWLVLIACASGPPTAAPDVQVWGALREMVHEGRIEGRVAIASVAKPGVYGIGALAGMQGEVAIVDGKVWISRGASAASADERAALLVAATVPSWTTIHIEADIPFAELDRRLEEHARSAGVNVERPFPFVVDGPFADVRWHVLSGPPSPGTDPHDHARDAVTGERATMTATLVGFFSKHHQGVFTHMGQHVHAHLVDPAAALAAHADAVSIRAGSTLRVPRVR